MYNNTLNVHPDIGAQPRVVHGLHVTLCIPAAANGLRWEGLTVNWLVWHAVPELTDQGRLGPRLGVVPQLGARWGQGHDRRRPHEVVVSVPVNVGRTGRTESV